MSVVDCRAIANFITSREPGRSLVDRIKALEGRDGVLSISIIHGFPAADVYDVGTKILVVTDAAPEKGRRLAVIAGDAKCSLSAKTVCRRCQPPRKRWRRRLAIAGGPVVLADRWDNPGGGVAGDSTFLDPRIAEACRHDRQRSARLWDPVAVELLSCGGRGSRAGAAVWRESRAGLRGACGRGW